MNYFTVTLTTYNAMAEVMYDIFIIVNVVCYSKKPFILNQEEGMKQWTHEAIIALLRSAKNTYLIKTQCKQHETLLAKKDKVIGKMSQETGMQLAKGLAEILHRWFMENVISAPQSGPLPGMTTRPLIVQPPVLISEP